MSFKNGIADFGGLIWSRPRNVSDAATLDAICRQLGGVE